MIAQLKEYAFYKPSNWYIKWVNLMAWYLNKTVKKKTNPKLDVAVLSYETLSSST